MCIIAMTYMGEWIIDVKMNQIRIQKKIFWIVYKRNILSFEEVQEIIVRKTNHINGSSVFSLIMRTNNGQTTETNAGTCSKLKLIANTLREYLPKDVKYSISC